MDIISEAVGKIEKMMLYRESMPEEGKLRKILEAVISISNSNSNNASARRVTIATPEWHWYCPECGRSCMRQVEDFDSELGDTLVVTCSSCGLVYEWKNDICCHNGRADHGRGGVQ